MTYSNMVMVNGTRAAILGASRGCRSAIRTMFRVPSGSRELATMQPFVAGNTKSDAVRNVRNQIRIISEWFYVVSMKVLTCFTAFLASVTVAVIDLHSPFSKITFGLRSFAQKGCATFPRSRFIADKIFRTPLVSAWIRAELSVLITTIKGFATITALTNGRRVALRPTGFGTISGGISTIRFYFVSAATYFASLYNPCVFHKGNYTTQHAISPAYVAVAIQRWVDVTGKEPVIKGNLSQCT